MTNSAAQTSMLPDSQHPTHKRPSANSPNAMKLHFGVSRSTKELS